MSNLELFFLTLFTTGVTIISYKGYATQKGWPIGKLFSSGSSILNIFGILSIAISFFGAFFYVKWYFVLLGALTGWLISGVITAIFHSTTQYIVLVLIIISLVLLISII